MNSYKWLFIKEWKMMKGFIIGKYVIVFLILMFTQFTGEAHISESLIGLLMVAFIILPAALLFNLNTESVRLQLFLHNPQSIHRLLSVKIMFCFLLACGYIIVIMIAFVGTELTLSMIGSEYYLTTSMLGPLFYFCFHMVLISLYPAMIILFLWTLHQIWRTYIGAISILLVVITLFIGSLLIGLFQGTHFYTQLTEWGLLFIKDAQYSYRMFDFGYSPLYMGKVIFYGLMMTILYLASAYLIDRKVEV